MKDLTCTTLDKITVLRGFKEGQWLVAQGTSWYGKGLNKNFKEFNDYISAFTYFNQIK
jgi:hypothetical protein